MIAYVLQFLPYLICVSGRPQGTITSSSLITRQESVLVKVVNGKTSLFAVHGQPLTFTSQSSSTLSAGSLSVAGLIAAEKTQTITSNGDRVLIAYYQEANTAVAHTSHTGMSSPGPTSISTPVGGGDDVYSGLNDDAKKWLRLHNDARKVFGASELKWRDDLVEKAKRNAQLCTGDHSNAGENIAAQSGDLSPDLSVKWWMAEKVFYNWDSPGFQDKTGHFTQAVWKNSQYVGCYLNECEAGTIFEAKYGVSYQATCEYDPAGNYVNDGEFEKNVGRRTGGTASWKP